MISANWHWFDFVGTLRSYTPKKWCKLEKFQFILTIFEVYATGNTAQLGPCGGYELSQVFPAPLRYWYGLRTTLEKYTLKKLWKFEQFRFIFAHCDGQHCSVGLLWGYELSQVFPTSLCYWFDLRTTLESYTLKKWWWKFEQFRFILIIFPDFSLPTEFPWLFPVFQKLATLNL